MVRVLGTSSGPEFNAPAPRRLTGPCPRMGSLEAPSICSSCRQHPVLGPNSSSSSSSLPCFLLREPRALGNLRRAVKDTEPCPRPHLHPYLSQVPSPPPVPQQPTLPTGSSTSTSAPDVPCILNQSNPHEVPPGWGWSPVPPSLCCPSCPTRHPCCPGPGQWPPPHSKSGKSCDFTHPHPRVPLASVLGLLSGWGCLRPSYWSLSCASLVSHAKSSVDFVENGGRNSPA